MFYSQFILAKKGPLGTIWIAAHLERKLRKNQVADTDIGVSVDSILSPDVPIALRLSSHLLLGVVRIYSRKVNYLFHDCSEALLKVKQAFRSTAVDLPPEESTAPYHSITLPDTFDLDDFELPDGDIFQGDFVDHHVSTREQITLQDSMDGVIYSTSQFGLDERFGDGDTSQIGMDLDEEEFLDKVTAAGHTVILESDNVDPPQAGQPMTPFMGMDMDMDDDDTIMGDRIMVDMLTGAKVGNIDSNAPVENVVDDPAPICGSHNQSSNLDGHGFPFGQPVISSTDPSAESTQHAPYTPRLLEDVVQTSGQCSKNHAPGLVNGSSQCHSEEVMLQGFTNNLQYEPEHRDTGSVSQENLRNLSVSHNFQEININEVGDCSLFDNRSSETNVFHMPQDTQAKKQEDPSAMAVITSISFDVGRAVSSPISVLAEQLKPISPVPALLDTASALPNVVEKAETSQNGDIINDNPSFSEADHVHDEGEAALVLTMDAVPASTLVETSIKTIPGSENVSAHSEPVNACHEVLEGLSLNGCVSHAESSGSESLAKVGPAGDLPRLFTLSSTERPLGSVGEHELNKDENTGCSGPEGAEFQHLDRPDEGLCEHHHVLRACISLSKSNTTNTVDSNLVLDAPHLLSTGAEPCSLAILGQVDSVQASEISSVVQGVECEPLSTRDAIPEANKSTDSQPSNYPVANVSNLNECPETVISKDCQLRNLNYPTSYAIPVPEPERLLSAPASVHVASSDCLVIPTTGREGCFSPASSAVPVQDCQLRNLNCPESCAIPAPEPDRLLPAPSSVFVAPSDWTVQHTSGREGLFNYPASSAVPLQAFELGNLNHPASCATPAPEPEKVLPAPASVLFAPSAWQMQPTTGREDCFNYPAFSAIPVQEPERFLSAPATVPVAPSDWLVQSTSRKGVSTGFEVSGHGLNTLSGRKRQLMESETIQWDSSAAKFSGMHPRRTMDSVPDDYDLLSSILVGKKSAVLNLKPTPQSETTIKKRPRATPRTSAPKRKVLLDDTMVLHGDTIRQHLTSTEDIRRMRKKAPCTRPEIWMIQKQLLEDEIFVEPLFTGMSSELTSLHHRTYDTTNFRGSEMNVDHTLTELPDEFLLSKNTDLSGEANPEGTSECVVIENVGKHDEPTGTLIQTENRSCEDNVLNPIECDIQEQTRPTPTACISPYNLQKDELNIVVSMEIDKGSEIPDVNDHADTVVSELPIVNGNDCEARCNDSVGSVITSLSVDRSSGIETVTENDKNLDSRSFKKDFFIMERGNHRGGDAINGVEVNEEGIFAAGISLENDGSVQETSGSDPVKVVEQNIPQYHQVDACEGCSSLVNDMLEKGVDVLADASTPMANEKSLLPTIFVGCERSMDPTVVTNEYAKEEVKNESVHVICDASTPLENDKSLLPDLSVGSEGSPDSVVVTNDSVHVICDVSTPLENDKSLLPNIFVGSEGSTDPTVVTNDYAKVGIHNESVHVTCDAFIEGIQNEPVHVTCDASAPLENDKCPSPNILLGSEGSTDQTVVINNYATEGIRSELAGVICNENVNEKDRENAGNSSGIMSTDDPQGDLSCPGQLNANTEIIRTDVAENPESREIDLGRIGDDENRSCHVANQGDDETALLDNASVNTSIDLEDTFDDNDTGFLNFDDDEAVEEDDTSMPSAEEAGVLDTSGWSSRTRGVARYLQTVFDTESGHGRKVLSMENLLSGKSRKEASRMFFETLVLKTRDYIHVEQENPFDSIKIKPMKKLVKSNF